jgi:hypothetical protein
MGHLFNIFKFISHFYYFFIINVNLIKLFWIYRYLCSILIVIIWFIIRTDSIWSDIRFLRHFNNFFKFLNFKFFYQCFIIKLLKLLIYLHIIINFHLLFKIYNFRKLIPNIINLQKIFIILINKQLIFFIL